MLKIKTDIKDPIKNYIIWGIVVIFVLSSFMHFLYDISGKMIIFAIISPINESIWEHLKITLLPTIIWWIITYNILKKYKEMDFKKWIFSSIISFVVGIIFILIFYYFYSGAFGIQSVFLDVLGLLIGITFGQLVALKIYNDAKISPVYYYIVFTAFIILIVMFITFTFETPHIPLFKDLSTGKYGLD